MPDSEGVRPHDDAAYLLREIVEAEPVHFWFRNRRAFVLQALNRYFAGARRILDVGCGTGFVLQEIEARFPEAVVFGCDRLPDALQRARRRTIRTIYVLANVLKLPVCGTMDAVTVLDVLEHIDDDTALLQEIHSALKPGGGIVVTVPQHQWLWSRIDEFSRHRRRYSRGELAAKVSAAGFEVVYCTSLFGVTLPLLLLARLRSRGADFDPGAELRLNRTVNRLLHAMIAPERALLRAGGGLPLGSSLLLVARRR
jgi:SAM-dependent methyltransferase